ncbi:hypothetical protein BDE02_02G192400 [Populus trichocarpa]|nr:hypothetical protein BDE02_02G192400 [Populus trichocarpa]
MLFYLTTLNLEKILTKEALKFENTLWEALDKKYKDEDANMKKKFIVNKFLYFKMVDLRTTISQVQEFHLILHDIYVEGM